MRTLGVGLLGLGNSGWFYHAEGTLARSHRFRLAAVCTKSKESARRGINRFGCRGYTDWEGLFVDSDVEIVVVALPHGLHRDATIQALKAGKHVVVEKPMSVTTAEADEMIHVAKKNGLVLTVFQQRRWEADFQEVKQIVNSGKIGEVWNIQIRRSHRGKYRVAAANEPHTGDGVVDWVQSKELAGGGVSYLIAPHVVDHALHLVDRPLQAVSARTRVYEEDEVEHYFNLLMEFSGDTFAQIEIYRETAIAPIRWMVQGTAGSIVGPANGSSLEVRRFDEEPEVIDNLPPLRQCDDFYDNLYDAIVHGGPLAVKPEEGRDVVRVLELGLESARLGGRRLNYSKQD